MLLVGGGAGSAVAQEPAADAQKAEAEVERLNANWGELHRAGKYAEARQVAEQAVALAEKALGPDHPDTAGSLNNLANLLKAMGDLPAARPLYERALAIREKSLGPDHPDTATSLNNLAAVLKAMGDLPAARPLYERALAIREKALGPDHPDTAIDLNNLAALLQATGDLPAARPLFKRALAIREKALGPDHPETALSLNNLGHLLKHMGDLPAALRYYERALAIDEKALGPFHPDTALSLNNLAALLQDMGDLPAARPLYERARAFLDPSAEDVLAALPAGTALVDVLENRGNLWCWVLLPGKEIRSFDLGKAADVAPLADAFRQALERRSGDSAAILAAWRTAGEKLRAVLAAPLAAAMDGTQEICFCLDGTLATVPIGLLPWGEGEPGLLIESVRVRHQTSGAGVALAAATQRKAGAPALLVLGGVDYGTPAAARPGGRTRAWSSLPATETEAKGVADRFRRRFADAAVTAVAGKQATEAAVKTHAPAARYIHAATHGFFELETLRKTLAGTRGASAEMQIVPMSASAPVAAGESRPRPGGGQNPLLLSGLILAGANADPRPGEDDGWLTAEEVQGLDLTATELVALSACSTGRGELAAGEGVLGLQRALTVAGARGFLLSLWAVPDADTQELMERFYDTLWAKDEGDPAEALRAAQLALLAEDRKAGKFRPHRWGAWVLVR